MWTSLCVKQLGYHQQLFTISSLAFYKSNPHYEHCNLEIRMRWIEDYFLALVLRFPKTTFF